MFMSILYSSGSLADSPREVRFEVTVKTIDYIHREDALRPLIYTPTFCLLPGQCPRRGE